jgi:hypothetical protein
MVFALGCSACSTLPSATNADFAQAIATGKQALITDLQAAEKDAHAHKDEIAETCYTAEIRFLQNIPAVAPPPQPTGPVLLFQMKRDVVGALDGTDPESVKVACAPLWVDEQQEFARFTTTLAALGIVLPK